MTFDDYVDLIAQSVSETGYNKFLSSLCSIEGENVVMKVLDADISEDSDEAQAKDWASHFMEQGRTLFLAYRCGQRTVTVLELCGFNATRMQQIKVHPHVSSPACER